jgi:AcrR family transcriptional regulator
VGRTTQVDTGEATRDRVLRLADALFARRGYAAVSMRDVAVASGVTKPALYYHFRDKDALFSECILINQLQLGQRLRNAIDEVDGFNERVAAAAGVLISGAAHHPVRIHADAVEHLPDDLRVRVVASFDDNVTAPLVRLFDSARAEGELCDGMTPAFAAAALVGLCTATLPGLDELGASADGDARGIAFGALPQQIASLVLNGVAA